MQTHIQHFFYLFYKFLFINKLIISIIFFTAIYNPLVAQDINYQINDDSVVVKPDYRNHLNIPDYNPRLMPLNRQTSSTGVWTELNPKVPRVTYFGVHFVNKDTGWACGDLGAVIKTIDGGSSWTVIETNTTLPILKVRSYNGGIVIASGYDGLILRSTDGGETFTQTTTGLGNGFDLWGLEMINDTLGWACGATALLKTTDGGENWQIMSTPGYTGNLWWIDFLNENYGFIAADGKVLRTTDGGSNWEIIQAGDSAPLYCIDIIDSLHIAAAGYGGTNYSAKNIYSSDGGSSWINGGTLTTEEVNCIQYVNPDTGYLLLSNIGLYKTTNRGQSWTHLIGSIGEYELSFLYGNNGYSAGPGLKIYKAVGNFDLWNRLIINDNFSDVFFVSDETGFAISGVLSVFQGLYKTTNGGVNWNGVPGPSGQDILFLDSLTGFIGSNVIYKTTDGGETWYIPNGGSGGAGKIFFIDETVGWAVRSNVIYKTTDSGENWFTQFTAPSSVIFTNIHFVDSLNGWTSGGRPYKTTDGGNNWVQQTNTIIWNSDDVYFLNIETGWIGKYSSINNSLFKTDNGGITWNPIPEVIGARKFYFFPNPSHWFIIGFSRYYITNDFGNSWLEFTDDVPTGLVSFTAPNNNLGYFVGNLGLILRYNDTTYIPVELNSFIANVNENNVILNWSTSSELNNRGFEIERSNDKTNWEMIMFINGNGTTTEINKYTFTDNLCGNNSQNLYYRLKQIDFDGTFEYSKIIEIAIETPSTFLLSQNYPNPYNPETNIDYRIPEETFVNITLYDITGRKINELVNEKKRPGYYTLKLKGGDLSSGIYFYRLLTTNGYTIVKKLTILK